MDYVSQQDKMTEHMFQRENERQLDIKKKREQKKLLYAENEQSGIFLEIFQNKIKCIKNLIESTNVAEKSTLPNLFNEIFKIIRETHKIVTDASIFIRNYDMRVCLEVLQELDLQTQQLEYKLVPKKKFGFKTRKNAKVEHKDLPIDETDSRPKLEIRDDFFGYKNKTNEILSFDKESLYKKDVRLQDLSWCVVRLFGSPSTLHMSNISNCLILCGPVSTSVFVENCNNSKLAIACQQLRFHSSKDCDIYLHVVSRAIIEDCHNISVAPYNLTYHAIAEDFALAGLDRNVNHWNTVDDFNWLFADKSSPNWAIMDQENIIADWESYDHFQKRNL